jgi:hypothetical protein
LIQHIQRPRVEDNRRRYRDLFDEVFQVRRGHFFQPRAEKVFIFFWTKDTQYGSKFTHATSDRSSINPLNPGDIVEAK